MSALPFETRSAGMPEEESQLVERLAQARTALQAAHEAWTQRLSWQKANAVELFERRQRDVFRADLKAWRADPFTNKNLFGKTALSATWLKNFWQAVLAGLSSPIGITFDQAKDIVTAAGGDWRADRIDALRGHIMGFYLALSPRPEAALRHWVAESLGIKGRRGRRTRKPTRPAESNEPKNFETDEAAADFETVMARARYFLTTVPNAEKARAGLLSIAAEEAEIWPGRAERLRKSNEIERNRCVEGATCQDLGSAADMRETRRIRRDLARAQRLVDQLERRLTALRRKAASKPVARRTKAASPGISVRPVRNPSIAANDFETISGDNVSESRTESFETNDRAEKRSSASACSNAIIDDGESAPQPPSRFENGRRPDPQAVAKAWRAKTKPGFRQTGSSIGVRSTSPAAGRG